MAAASTRPARGSRRQGSKSAPRASAQNHQREAPKNQPEGGRYLTMKIVIPILLAVLPLAAQEIKMPVNLDKLAAKASEVVDVSLDGALLQLASRFLSDKDPDEAHVKKLVGGLKGVYVKSFEFEDRDQYKESDVEELRTQLKAPGWSRIVSSRSKRNGDNADVYLKTDAGQISGLAV